MSRNAIVERRTKETIITAVIDLDDPARGISRTGLPFLDHMLDALQSNANFFVQLDGQGDLEVDDHHLVEDCALTLGTAIAKALGERVGIARSAHSYGILDDSLIFAAVDLSGRSFADIQLNFKRESIGGIATENITHFFQSLASRLGGAVHIRKISGMNDHHQTEAAFKAIGAAIGIAAKLSGRMEVPSTKGTII